MDLLGGPDRSITYRFRDLNNRPLAAVRLYVSFTNSIADPQPVNPSTSDASHTPQFTQLQDILDVTVGGPAAASQTLLQEISKEPSFQELLKATPDTTPDSFRSACNSLESALQSVYGLNTFDTALAMAQVLSQQSTLYLNYKRFYNSGCFHSRGLLKQMGILDFETAPSS